MKRHVGKNVCVYIGCAVVLLSYYTYGLIDDSKEQLFCSLTKYDVVQGIRSD